MLNASAGGPRSPMSTSRAGDYGCGDVLARSPMLVKPGGALVSVQLPADRDDMMTSRPEAVSGRALGPGMPVSTTTVSVPVIRGSP